MDEPLDEYYYLKPIEPKNKPMSNKTRLVIWSIFIVVSIVFAFANDGIRETWWINEARELNAKLESLILKMPLP
jgi:hypothetical protein